MNESLRRLFFLSCLLAVCCRLGAEEHVERNRQANDHGEGRHQNGDHIFVPTDQWQVVRKDRVLPRGLEVRMNLATGLIEARLAQKKKPDEKSSLVAVNEEPTGEHDSETQRVVLSESRLKAALKNIKNDDASEDDVARTNKIRQKFRSYEEIRQHLGDLNLTPKTDSEILVDLIDQHVKLIKKSSKLKDENREQRFLTILEDLDYLVHQYDNANEFIRLDGIKKIVLVDLNATSERIRLETIKLLGSCVQNNPPAQINALENNCVAVLLRILALDPNDTIKSRTIFAIGTLLRRFPLAQSKFLDNAGLSVFIQLLGSSSTSIKTRLKIVTLINDLVNEHEDSIVLDPSDRFKQYQHVDLKSKLGKHVWCEKLYRVLNNVLEVDADDYDGVERCLEAVETVQESCEADVASKLRQMAYKLNARYAKLASLEGGVEYDYFDQLAETCARIYNFFTSKYKAEL